MPYCREHLAVKTEGEKRTYVTLPCDSWLCEECVEARKKRLICEGIAGKPDMFMTLTIRRSRHPTPELAAKALSRAWAVVRKRIMRKTKRPLPFLLVVERHPSSGWPHFHLLLRSKFISHKWLSKQMQEIIDSKVVWIERIYNPQKAAGYCAKYCSKAVEKIGTTKRYWQSADYDLRPAEEKAKYKKGSKGFVYSSLNINDLNALVVANLWFVLKTERHQFVIWTGLSPPTGPPEQRQRP